MAQIIAVEIDAYDGQATQTQRFFTGRGPLIATIDGNRVQYMPGLLVPLNFGTTISAEQYGAAVRGAPSGGDISYDLNANQWTPLAYHYLGREVRVSAGETALGYAATISVAATTAGPPVITSDDTVSISEGETIVMTVTGDVSTGSNAELSPGQAQPLERVFTGRVTDLKHTMTGVVRVSLSTTDAGIDLDNPIVGDQYDDTALEPLRGKPKPELRGTCKNVQPALIDDANQIYQVSRLALVSVEKVRVGGVEWQASATGIAAAGQYTASLAAGTIALGSTTLGQEVRVDATGAAITTAGLMTAIVTEAGGSVDTDAMAQLDLDAPYLISWYTGTEPVNRLDALDQVMSGVGGFWFFNSVGECVAGVLAAPDDVAELTITPITIAGMASVGVLPPAWRIRIEYARNWQPVSNFLEGVTDAEREAMSSGGIIAAPFEDENIKTVEPRAVDVPLIRSLVLNEIDAIAIRDRLIAAWSVSRRLYDVSANDAVPTLYGTVGIEMQMVDGNFRVHSVLRSLGGGPMQLRLWGESGIAGALTPLVTADNDMASADNDILLADAA